VNTLEERIAANNAITAVPGRNNGGVIADPETQFRHISTAILEIKGAS
jgi:hypothetical protein